MIETVRSSESVNLIAGTFCPLHRASFVPNVTRTSTPRIVRGNDEYDVHEWDTKE